MSIEHGPSGHEAAVYHFNRYASEYSQAKAIMSHFVEAGYLDQKNVFEEDEERIDLAGEELTRALLSPSPSAEDIAITQRCLRFGLRLSMLLGQRTPGYMAGLDTLQVVLQEPEGYKTVTSSYVRYLSKQPHMQDIVLGNMPTLTEGANRVTLITNLNVISFVLEEADRETFVNREMMSMYMQVSEMFDHPPEL